MRFDELEYSKHFNFSLWKKLLKYVFPYKKNLIILFLLMAFIGGIDAVFPLFTKYAVDKFVVGKSVDRFWLFCVILTAVGVIQAVNVRIMILQAGKIEAGVPYDIRKIAFKRLQELPLEYYDHTPTGWIMSRMTSDIRRLGL
ncbi:MAG TPA: ABC transporter ATP-binding protein, partial [Clostridiaceae bacterium]|nr:ABC transporter ATP-binding protein [Clostridiaceae bacterium]